MSASKTLAVLPTLTAIQRPDGRLVLAGRFMSGMALNRKLWDGRLIALIEPEEESAIQKNQDRTLGGDNVDVDPKDAPFEIELVDYHERRFADVLRQADVALCGIHYRQNHVAKIGNKVGTPVVYTSEYTLKTRLQIVRASVKNPLLRARRIAWEVNQERIIRKTLKISAGLQANGTPTFEAYRALSKNPILFFDGRGSDAMLIPTDALETRLEKMKESKKLRLAFAGRLNAMKGADHLLHVARNLLDLGVPFSLDIYGGGILADGMRERIAKEQMGHAVHMHGYVQFDELMPHLGSAIDLFLCCHVQGDPSGMYLEMLGKGLPFIGYANEALAGILRRTNVGRAVPVHDAQGCAAVIEGLSSNRDQIVSWSRAAVAFARSHTFDATWRRRLDHLRELAR